METVEILGKYELKRTLGKGAMGTVYEGWDPIIARRVAIKTVRVPDAQNDPETAEALTRFRREAQAAGRLSHPNIVAVFDYGETDDLAYIVMEFVDGPSMKSLLDRQERFGLPDTLRIMADLLTGLQFSHDRGVVHRDIKPANIMLTSDGRAKIADFGIARIESSAMTQAGIMLGTPAYMSPEQFTGQVADARTDLYSAGVVLYQLLTGERPFDGGMSAIMHKALHTDPPLPSLLSVTCPPAFDSVVRRAMAKRPDERFQSATAFLAALQAVAGEKPPGWDAEDANRDATVLATTVRPSSAATGSGPTLRPAVTTQAAAAATMKRFPHRMTAAAVAAVLALVVGGTWFLLRHGLTPDRSAPTVSALVPGTAGVAPTVTPLIAVPRSTAPRALAQPVPQAAPQAGTVAPDDLRQRLVRLTGGTDCALISGSLDMADGVTLAGLAGAPEAVALRHAVAGLGVPSGVAWHVSSVNTTFCPALNLLHSVVPGFGATGPRLLLSLEGGQTRLHDGAFILPRLVMPDFAGSLVLDYVEHDGTLVHLYPQVADLRRGMGADPPRVFRPGATVSLGGREPGHPGWEVGPPYGTDMIIAIVSSQPLFAQSRPSDVEPAAVYLRDLQAAVNAARQRGDRLAGAALTVDTLPR